MPTKIEWTNEVWNPVTGCTKVSSGCKNCYAERIAHRFWGERKFTDVQCHPERLEQPLRWKKPRMVFVNSMSDLFHEDVPDDFIDHVFAVIALVPKHTFQILTKRPARMAQYLSERIEGLDISSRIWMTANGIDRGANMIETPDWPLPNVWLGISCEDQKTADERTPILLQCPAAVRFVSIEPMLGGIDLSAYFGGAYCALPGDRIEPYYNFGISWVIVGGESGPNARPMHPDWARAIRDQCQAAGVPFFFKQWGEWLPGTHYTAELREIDTDEVTSKFLCLDWDLNGTWTDNRKPGWVEADQYEEMLEPVYRVGKKRAGRVLDGREWNEYPEASGE